MHIKKGTPIGQIVLDKVNKVTKPYNGKYNQGSNPQPPIFERV